MKHGLKQEIKRGLSVLMAVSMVASSALPVMAEEVVEEAVEVEVVSEDVADEAGDVVVDVAEEKAAEEELIVDVAEETVSEEAADTQGPIGGAEEDHVHTIGTIDGVHIANEDDDPEPDYVYVSYTCGVKGCSESLQSDYVSFSHLPVANWEGYAIQIEASSYVEKTCTKDGKVTVLVLKKGETDQSKYIAKSKEFVIPAGHVIGSNKIEYKAPTCTEDGEATYVCDECGAKIQKGKIEKLGHAYLVSDFVWSADYNEVGVNVTCNHSGCTFSKYVEIPYVTGESGTDYKPATCLNQGYVKKWVNEEKAEETLNNALDLTGNNTIYDIDIDQNSFDPITVTLKKLKHNITKVEFNWDDNTYSGGTCKIYCSNIPAGYHEATCEAELDADKTVAATCGANGKSVWHLIATYDGKEYDSCDYGVAEYTVETLRDSSQHSFIVDPKAEDAIPGTLNNPTCTKPGSGQFICKYCKKVSDPGITIPALGHTLKETGKYVIPVTCEHDGFKEAECTTCNKTVGVGIAPSIKCNTNGNIINTAELTEKQIKTLTDKNRAHKYSVVKEDTKFTDDGLRCWIEAKCEFCFDYEVGSIKSVEVVDKEATEDETGIKHYEATLKFTDSLDKEWSFTEKSKSFEIPAKGGQKKATVSIASKTVTYNGNRQYVAATTNSNVKPVVSYYKDEALTQKYSGAPYTAGTYYVKATVAESEKYTAAESEVVKLVIEKANPTVNVKASKTSVKNTKKNTVNIIVTQKNLGGQQGKVTYTAPSSKIKVNSKGVVTIKKGTKKGTYKVVVNVKATTNFNAYTKTIKITVK